jgi:1,2-diacylglycerol 3-beta-galactosyltransferase
MTAKPRILILFSDTGGGHRSAAQAVIEAMELEFPDRFDLKMIDALRHYAPSPLRHAPDFYPYLVQMKNIWGTGYHLMDGKRRIAMINHALWQYMRLAMKRMIRENPAELYVSVHPLLNMPVCQALRHSQTPFVTVVTDMVSAHAFWFERRANLVIVPVEEARLTGINFGLDPQQIITIGQPIADRFCHPQEDKNETRQRLGWRQDKPVVLLVGGGDGAGPLEETVFAIQNAGLDLFLVVVTGRNHELKERLESQNWKFPIRIYGFIREMPDFMSAADIIITKAGSQTVNEAFIAGLPIILYSRFLGQEDGNVLYIVGEKAGIWAPRPDRVVNSLQEWLEYPDKCKQASENSKRLGRPYASRQIAHQLAAQLGVKCT